MKMDESKWKYLQCYMHLWCCFLVDVLWYLSMLVAQINCVPERDFKVLASGKRRKVKLKQKSTPQLKLNILDTLSQYLLKPGSADFDFLKIILANEENLWEKKNMANILKPHGSGAPERKNILGIEKRQLSFSLWQCLLLQMLNILSTIIKTLSCAS